MNREHQKNFGCALIVLLLALLLICSGCGIGEERVLNLQDRVRAIYSIAADNDRLTFQQKDELKTHYRRLQADIGSLK